jgi:hypothetical protein
MTEDLWFGVAVIVLLAAMAAAFARWGREPGEGRGSPVGRFVLIATAVGGLIGAPFWWLDLPPSFAWDLPPLASRMLGVAALAFGVTGIAVLEHPSAARERLFYMLILAYLVPLALAAVTLHLDRFDFARPVTYGFFAVVIVLCVGSALELSRGKDAGPVQCAPGGTVRGWLLVAGVALAVWGAALFATPHRTLSAGVQLAAGRVELAADRGDADDRRRGLLPVAARRRTGAAGAAFRRRLRHRRGCGRDDERRRRQADAAALRHRLRHYRPGLARAFGRHEGHEDFTASRLVKARPASSVQRLTAPFSLPRASAGSRSWLWA